MDIEFDYKGDPLGGTITNCKYKPITCIQILFIVDVQEKEASKS